MESNGGLVATAARRLPRSGAARERLAGIWNAWIDKTTGERHESFSMLTINADEHPIMRRMHRNELGPKTSSRCHWISRTSAA